MTIDANTLRIGLGTDLHVLETGRPCIIGGVHHDCPVGPKSWSDGDPVLHALADALLGAGGLPDLGTLFPDRDPEWRDADSSVFVVRAVAMLGERHLRPLSCDVVVACERPRIAPARDRIRGRLADLLGLPVDRVNVKGKSLEGAGGSVETITTTCVVLVGELRSAGD